MDDFRAIYRALVHRPEYEELFRAYSSDGIILTDTQLMKFLVKEQFQTEANETTVLEIIMKYEPIDEGTHSLSIWYLALSYCSSVNDCVLPNLISSFL